MISARYGVLPSVIMKRDLSDFCLDLLVAREGIKWENKAAEKAQRASQRKRRR